MSARGRASGRRCRAIFLSGPTTRNAAKPGSDLDLFLTHADHRFSLIGQIRLEGRARKPLGTEGNLMTERSLAARDSRLRMMSTKSR